MYSHTKILSIVMFTKFACLVDSFHLECERNIKANKRAEAVITPSPRFRL